MKYRNLGKSELKVPKVIAGCMRIADFSVSEAAEFIDHALKQGCNFFDHADIYSDGVCQQVFGNALKTMCDVRREDMIIQSKCGIVPGVMFDFSREKILLSVDKTLRELQTEYLDVLLLHRPDVLCEPEEVAEAFDILENSGKVRYFGVSNQNPAFIKLLQKTVKQPILVNQLQLSVAHTYMIDSSLQVNMSTEGAINRDGSVIEYCRLEDIVIQAWSPFQYGYFEGTFLGNAKFPELNAVLEELAEKYGVSVTTIAAAWILRHPAGMQIVSGTTRADRFEEICRATDIQITRKEWYQIYMAAGNILP